ASGPARPRPGHLRHRHHRVRDHGTAPAGRRRPRRPHQRRRPPRLRLRRGRRRRRAPARRRHRQAAAAAGAHGPHGRVRGRQHRLGARPRYDLAAGGPLPHRPAARRVLRARVGHRGGHGRPGAARHGRLARVPRPDRRQRRRRAAGDAARAGRRLAGHVRARRGPRRRRAGRGRRVRRRGRAHRGRARRPAHRGRDAAPPAGRAVAARGGLRLRRHVRLLQLRHPDAHRGRWLLGGDGHRAARGGRSGHDRGLAARRARGRPRPAGHPVHLPRRAGRGAGQLRGDGAPPGARGALAVRCGHVLAGPGPGDPDAHPRPRGRGADDGVGGDPVGVEHRELARRLVGRDGHRRRAGLPRRRAGRRGARHRRPRGPRPLRRPRGPRPPPGGGPDPGRRL
ncbi:MAG: Uncharacterized MFS-type transporter, partial [uncultured Actinomycetospora sp.]